MDQLQRLVLREHLTTIESCKKALIIRWVRYVDVQRVLLDMDIDANQFVELYANNIVEYFLDVIKGKRNIGRCPVIENLLLVLKAKNMTVAELYVICVHFRESLVTEIVNLNLLTESFYSAICYLFDANFKAVLQVYAETITQDQEIKNEFQNLVENSLNEIYIFNTATLQFVYVNRGAVLNSGYRADELQKMTPIDIKPYYTKEQFQELIEPLLKHEQEQLIFETVHQRKNGSLYYVDIRLQLMHWGGMECFVAMINDITKRVEAIEEKENYYQMATHDYLTKIYNRQKFDALFHAEAKRAQRYNHPLSLILFDIDDFKGINDTYGHDAGDTVLVLISNLAKACLRESDIFARWGGEEFIILLPHTDLGLAIQKAEELCGTIASEHIENISCVTCSFGVAQVHDYENLARVFKDADDALYVAKKNGKNRVKACSL
jgi:diguanylate cyclase (GGDEF)-like protein/PAS domain S-box-containing protein